MDPHPTQNMSTTVCIPVIIIRSSFSPTVTLTLETSRIFEAGLRKNIGIKAKVKTRTLTPYRINKLSHVDSGKPAINQSNQNSGLVTIGLNF
ncbi:hypothetical protein Hanom_Chr10g00898521 [Helianthus anomalus]